MPRRAILLLIAAGSFLVSTTLGPLAQQSIDPPQCLPKAACGQHWLTSVGGTYGFVAKASDQKTGQALTAFTELPTGTVVRFDARLTTKGSCNTTSCNVSPHCGKGIEIKSLYSIYTLEIHDEHGNFVDGFYDNETQSVGSTPEHPTLVTLSRPGE
jgi:hypothetical protein